MPTIADMLAIGKRIEFEGESYDLREPNVLEMGMFERWLEQGAKDSARRDTEQSPDELAARLAKIDKEAAAGEFEFGGELAVFSLTKKKGIAQILFIVLSADYPKVTLELCQRMLAANVREIVAGLACKLVSDPLAVRAVLATLGLSEEWLLRNSPTNTDGSPTSGANSPTPTSSEPTTSSEMTTAPPG